MKILISTSKSIASFQLALLLKDQEILFGNDFNDFPDEKSNSLAHEILKFCLDHQIEQVFPLKLSEYNALLNSQILFEEFGIKVMLSTQNSQGIDKHKKAAHSFTELSAGLIALGYPNESIALGDAENRGELIVLDDKTKDDFQIWNQVKTLSFNQLGKWFNRSDFKPLHLYQLNGTLQQFYALIDRHKILTITTVDEVVKSQLSEMMKEKKLRGFYHIVVVDKEIIRMNHAKI